MGDFKINGVVFLFTKNCAQWGGLERSFERKTNN